MTVLADSAEAVRDAGTRGPVVAVLAGRGGGGASVFATAVAQAATESLLIHGIRGAVASIWAPAVRPSRDCGGRIFHWRAGG